jgi:hypothetical protein
MVAWSGEGADHTAGTDLFHSFCYRISIHLPKGGMDVTGLFLGTFRSSFYYAWQLSALPNGGVPVGARYPRFVVIPH